MSEPVIKLANVTKYYGASRGVRNVSLGIYPGEVFGFLGPNGAGKTTTISLMIDLIRPTSGSISIFGLDSATDSVAIRHNVGFLTGDIALDKGLTGWQQLEYFGNIHGNFDRKYVRDLAKRIDCRLNRKFKTLSRGNKQKVGLIAALMHNPDILILDEPTSGLDPIIQAEFNKIILERKKAGKTAFISSHMLSEVQEVCDRVAFIREGEIIAVKSLADIAKDSPKQVMIAGSNKSLTALIRKLPGIHDFKQKNGTINCTLLGDVNGLLKLLGKYKVANLTIQDADLEAVFMKYYEEGDV